MAATPGNQTSGLVLAQVQKPGLAEFLRQQIADTNAQGTVYDAQSFANSAPTDKAPYFLVRNDILLIATDYAGLRDAARQLATGPSGFAQTPFAQHVLQAYSRGAGMLFAADLKSMVGQDRPMHVNSNEGAALRFNTLDYLIVERRDFNTQEADNRATLAFTGPRQGLASWLAAPAPIGSLDFISADASGAVAGVVKSPAQMLADLLTAKHNDRSNPPAYVNDLAAAFGTDFALALDGPVLPKPSWRFVGEVNDPQRAQYAIEQALQDAARHSNEAAPKIQQSVQDGQTFYTIAAHGQEIDYTYADGYLVAGPSVALVMKSLTVHHDGNSLARSAAFRTLLPQGPRLDYSAVLYQNLAPVIQPLAGQLSGTELQSLQTIAAGSKPSAVVAYGEPDKIEVQTSSKFFGFDLNTLALGALLGNNPLMGRPEGTLR
jgi:hypothetical protein